MVQPAVGEGAECNDEAGVTNAVRGEVGGHDEVGASGGVFGVFGVFGV